MVVRFVYMMGLLTTPLIKSSRRVSSIAIPLSLTMFTTGIWWTPKSMLSPLLRAFADIFPPALTFDMMRDFTVWSRPLDVVVDKIAKVIMSLTLICIVVVLLYRGRIERIVHRFL